jgi:chemotaxis protein CheD
MDRPAAERGERRPHGVGTASSVYYDRGLAMQAAKILPGEYFVTGRDLMLVTVLGSCVAACIRDPGARIGGMNHFMLPSAVKDGDGMLGAPAHYGVYAMQVLIDELVKMGARRSALQAKVFGGGNLLRRLTMTNVGPRNAEFVLRFLAGARIPVLAQDLAHDYARKVYYHPRSGQVRLQPIRDRHGDAVVRREREYGRRIGGRAPNGEAMGPKA